MRSFDRNGRIEKLNDICDTAIMPWNGRGRALGPSAAAEGPGSRAARGVTRRTPAAPVSLRQSAGSNVHSRPVVRKRGRVPAAAGALSGGLRALPESRRTRLWQIRHRGAQMCRHYGGASQRSWRCVLDRRDRALALARYRSRGGPRTHSGTSLWRSGVHGRAVAGLSGWPWRRPPLAAGAFLATARGCLGAPHHAHVASIGT